MPARPTRSNPQSTKASQGASAPASPARREAFAILLEVERGHAHADDLLRSARVSALSSEDRHLTTALVLGTLRWQLGLDALIRPLLTRPNARLDPEILIALRLGAFQLLYLDRIPPHAAINESVSVAKSAGHRYASGMVNAVLRKLAASPRPSGAASRANASELAEATAHPLWFVERWIAYYGLVAAAEICTHGQHQPELTLHLTDPKLDDELVHEGFILKPGALLRDARRVVSGDPTTTALFRSGTVRIQEEGSQLIAELAGSADRNRTDSILDCCAAPGGKTLLLAERNPQARITAMELNPARAAALRQRFASIPSAARIHVEQADAAQLPASPTYGLILADVPCSGTGTLGRNPEIRHRLQAADLGRHHGRQCAILAGALRASSHRVVYSTCSLELEENAAIVREVLAEFPGWRQLSLTERVRELTREGVLTEAGAQRLLPCIAEDGSLTLLPGSLGPEQPTDGFFVALLERSEERQATSQP